MRLVDGRGNPIPTEAEREEAQLRLRDFMEKEEAKFNEWFRQNGKVNPPIKYDLDRKKWFWVEATPKKRFF